MIQTQLLKLEPPYQIISYGGEVAIHVATLIVIQEKTDAKGKTVLETHCRPVVSYSYKDFFAEAPQRLEDHFQSYLNGNDKDLALTPHPHAEGTIWDKADVAQVEVLGIVGVTKELDWKAFSGQLAQAKDVNDFHLFLRRHLTCLRDLVIGVKRCIDDPAMFCVDAYKIDAKHLWTDVFLGDCLIFSAAVKSMKAAKETWIEVADVCHRLILAPYAECTIFGAPWNEDDTLKNLANEASNELWLRRNSKPDGKV